MPNDLLDLNLGQVQAVIDGYSARIVDWQSMAIWSGYYSAYYSNAKHPKKPTDIIKRVLNEYSKGDCSRGNTAQEVDMDAELELFAQRDLRFLDMMGGNSKNACN